jgi:hypothetical protein
MTYISVNESYGKNNEVLYIHNIYLENRKILGFKFILI